MVLFNNINPYILLKFCELVAIIQDVIRGISMSEENKKPNLLVVEDDYENQKFLQIFLKRKFNLEICDSSETFYEKLNHAKFDIILMDISLRGKKTDFS